LANEAFKYARELDRKTIKAARADHKRLVEKEKENKPDKKVEVKVTIEEAPKPGVLIPPNPVTGNPVVINA